MGKASEGAVEAAQERGQEGQGASRRVGGARLDATSPLALASHLLGLARDADRTGLTGLAEQMLALAYAVLDQGPVAFV
ncbi:MAG: hypothetical protein ACRYG6_13420 [Janthinobacterium lividum]